MGKIVMENGFPFIDFNKEKNFGGARLHYNIDIANDAGDNGHLNHFGAEKLSDFIAKILIHKYRLRDKRSDSHYLEWNTDLNVYKARVKDANPYSFNNRLKSNRVLHVNEMLVSRNGLYKLILQNDGNLVLYKGQTPIWASQTPGKPIVECVIKEDGNLVLYDANKIQHWSTEINNNAHPFLVLQDDGNMVMFNKGTVVWASGTNQ